MEIKMSDNIQPDKTLNCTGLTCPMPLLKTKKMIKTMESGQVLEIISSDPGSKNDIPAFTERSGHEFIGEKDISGLTHFYLKIK
ncbi:MAG: SirA family protein [Candidatus Magnetoglobus multicellularis str. Araruama]|uniref:SirA family protein n=1 Tax=Candidatus Magnetoglobus multicellularis str. Araruama TaxID=890399 RepID=A0A1V1P117_9BACT|nr:MAG: SirA family protein [Candidatus Magnetoglobus multicellularis str. Araruama]